MQWFVVVHVHSVFHYYNLRLPTARHFGGWLSWRMGCRCTCSSARRIRRHSRRWSHTAQRGSRTDRCGTVTRQGCTTSLAGRHQSRWQPTRGGSRHAVAADTRWQPTRGGSRHAVAADTRWQPTRGGHRQSVVTDNRWSPTSGGSDIYMVTAQIWKK